MKFSSTARLVFSVLLAFVLWSVMFSPWTAPHVSFWAVMSCSAAILCCLSFLFNPGWLRHLHFSLADIFAGVAIAAVLWCVFWTGDRLSSMLFDFARPQVDAIYGIRSGASPWLLSALMLFLIGPAEEIFWRGYVQQSLSRRLGKNAGFALATVLYAAVHVSSFNFMLVMAALVAGTVWGALYRFFPDRFAAIIVSHAIWDAAVFIWFPI